MCGFLCVPQAPTARVALTYSIHIILQLSYCIATSGVAADNRNCDGDSIPSDLSMDCTAPSSIQGRYRLDIIILLF